MLLFLTVDSSDGLLYFFIGIGALIVWFSILRWAVRSNDIVKNQRLIIQIMFEQFKKQGASEEEIKKIMKQIENN
jgi:hypothetical protein